MTLTAWLVHRRDRAGDRWLAAMGTATEPRARRRLVLWDTLLDLWTRHGTRH